MLPGSLETGYTAVITNISDSVHNNSNNNNNCIITQRTTLVHSVHIAQYKSTLATKISLISCAQWDGSLSRKTQFFLKIPIVFNCVNIRLSLKTYFTKMFSLCTNVIQICFVMHKDSSCSSYLYWGKIVRTQIAALWHDIAGVQYICKTYPGFFAKIRSKMLSEAGRLISLLCWQRKYSCFMLTNKSYLLLLGKSRLSSSSQLKSERLKSPRIMQCICL